MTLREKGLPDRNSLLVGIQLLLTLVHQCGTLDLVQESVDTIIIGPSNRQSLSVTDDGKTVDLVRNTKLAPWPKQLLPTLVQTLEPTSTPAWQRIIDRSKSSLPGRVYLVDTIIIGPAKCRSPSNDGEQYIWYGTQNWPRGPHWQPGSVRLCVRI